MRSAHGAGFAYALGSILKIQNPDMVIGTSGNAASAICYAAQDHYDCLKTVWTECLSTSDFISYTHFLHLMNVDYLIDTVFRTRAASAIQALQKSALPYYISIVDAQTGVARFVDREDAIDPYELLRAAKAMPMLYRKKVVIQGRKYIDGAIGQPPQSLIDFALAEGATRIVFVDDAPNRKLFGKCIMFFYALSTPRGLRNRVLQDLFSDRTHSVPEGIELLYLHRDKMPVSVIGRNRSKLRATFELGVQDALRCRKKLERFLI